MTEMYKNESPIKEVSNLQIIHVDKKRLQSKQSSPDKMDHSILQSILSENRVLSEMKNNFLPSQMNETMKLLQEYSPRKDDDYLREYGSQ
jgi:hypothetical protein